MTKIRIQVEIEVPDDHIHGVSSYMEGNKRIAEKDVALMVHQNIFGLIKDSQCNNMSKRLDKMTLPDSDPNKPYLLRHIDADQDFWDQFVKNAKIKIVYDGGETADY